MPNPQHNPEPLASLIARRFESRDGQLLVGNVPIEEIAARYGTPLYVYSHDVMQCVWERLRNALPARCSVFYSIKANPNRAILQFFLERGSGLEVASGGELQRALQAGCPPQNILFAGPGKTDDELRFALRVGIREIHVESLAEAERLNSLCLAAGTTADIALRINPAAEAQGGAMRMGGKPAPFGIDEEQLDGVLDRVVQMSHLQIVGIHLFSGTQILQHEILLTQHRKAIALAKHVAQRVGRPLQTVDFGGGLGIPYFSHESPLDIDAFSAGLNALLGELQREPLFDGTEFILEPGRFLVGEAGLYVARVLEVKRSRGKTFVILDGGMHHHLAASGNLGQTIKRNYPVALLNKLNDEPSGSFDVVGPLCTPLDLLARKVSLPQPEPGDLFGVFQSGAYGRSASPLGFLSHPAPPEVLIRDGQTELICRRGDVSGNTATECTQELTTTESQPRFN